MSLSNLLDTTFPHVIARDFAKLMLTEMIGDGSARMVFGYKLDPKYVVKIETPAQSFQNVLEWETWNRIQHTKHAKWFAPCKDISGCGTVLIQARTFPFTGKLPKQVPAFFTDLKRANWGKYKGRLVCHDYGFHLLMENGMTSRMRKADWFA